MTATWLNDPSAYERISIVAVGITRTSHEQMHAALLYRAPNGELRAIHFCWHLDGRDGPAPKRYFWVEPGIRESFARSLASLCRIVAEEQTLNEVPFAFRLDESAVFDELTGKLMGPDGQGLTCATFVLCMFASVGERLVTDNQWPQRNCDVIWQERILESLTPEHDEYAKNLRNELGAIRYRPEEVVAAAAESEEQYPVPFARALPKGREVLERMGVLNLTCWYDPDVLCPYD